MDSVSETNHCYNAGRAFLFCFVFILYITRHFAGIMRQTATTRSTLSLSGGTRHLMRVDGGTLALVSCMKWWPDQCSIISTLLLASLPGSWRTMEDGQSGWSSVW